MTSPLTPGSGRHGVAAAQDRLDRLVAAANARHALKPRERLGQAYFNTLYFDGHDPEFADAIRGGELDPFYMDERVPAMLLALQGWWSRV